MSGIQDFIERIKFADAELKKKVVLGSIAGVLFLVAAVFLIRSLTGSGPAEVPDETQAAVAELRKELATTEEPPPPEEEPEPFQRTGMESPPE